MFLTLMPSTYTKAIYLVLIAITVALVSLRLGIYVVLQFPAPVGDGLLFASVSHYHCAEGIFKTPIFPWADSPRYIWHGIAQPALLSLLSYECTIAGVYTALAILMAATAVICMYCNTIFKNKLLTAVFTISTFALQAKLDFRPETLAIILVIISEIFIHRKSALFALAFTPIAWTQPSSFIVYAAWLLVFHKDFIFRRDSNFYLQVVVIVVVINSTFLVLYPFPIADHINALWNHGHATGGRIIGSDPLDRADLQGYLLISHFYPLFGVIFFALSVTLLLEYSLVICLFLPVWWSLIQAPLQYYLYTPFFVAMLFQVAVNHRQLISVDSHLFFRKARYLFTNSTIVLVYLCATSGLLQGIARDSISFYKFRSTPQSSVVAFENLVLSGKTICDIPPFFTFFLSSDKFEKSFTGELRGCRETTPKMINLYQSSGRSYVGRLYSSTSICTLSHEEKDIPYIGTLFNSDSGYSFIICSQEQ